MHPVLAALSIKNNFTRRLLGFTIKVNILCFVSMADASLWSDHLNHNVVSRKKPAIHVYAVWNIRMDIQYVPVSKVKEQAMAAACDPVCDHKQEQNLYFTLIYFASAFIKRKPELIDRHGYKIKCFASENVVCLSFNL